VKILIQVGLASLNSRKLGYYYYHYTGQPALAGTPS